MKHSLLVSLALTSSFVSACGGGGGTDPANPPPVVNPPAPVEKLGGFFSGELGIDAGMISEECGALVTEDGQFRFLCIFTDLQIAGMSSRDGNSMSGSGLAFSTLTFLDGSFVTDATIQATLVPGTSLTGTWTATSGDSGTFNMVYDAEYEKSSSLAFLEGIWQGVDPDGNPVSTFIIDDLGSFTGSNSSGCSSSGTFLLLDSRYNIYQMNSTIVGCPLAGDYSGMALLFDDITTNDGILFAISNDQRALLVGLEKLP